MTLYSTVSASSQATSDAGVPAALGASSGKAAPGSDAVASLVEAAGGVTGISDDSPLVEAGCVSGVGSASTDSAAPVSISAAGSDVAGATESSSTVSGSANSVASASEASKGIEPE